MSSIYSPYVNPQYNDLGTPSEMMSKNEYSNLEITNTMNQPDKSILSTLLNNNNVKVPTAMNYIFNSTNTTLNTN